MIKNGLRLEFDSLPNTNEPVEHPVSVQEQALVEQEIHKLLKKKVLQKTTFNKGDFCSGVFTRLKKDGSRRMILSLKILNTFMEYNHFKMESIQNVIQVIRPECLHGLCRPKRGLLLNQHTQRSSKISQILQQRVFLQIHLHA